MAAAVIREARAELLLGSTGDGRVDASVPRSARAVRPSVGQGAPRRSGSAGARLVLGPLQRPGARLESSASEASSPSQIRPPPGRPPPNSSPRAGVKVCVSPSKGRPSSGPNTLQLLRPSGSPRATCPSPPEQDMAILEDDEAETMLRELEAFDTMLLEQETALQSIALSGSALLEQFAETCRE
ncbi:unnamed protein product, partial [Polarella glacialis]